MAAGWFKFKGQSPYPVLNSNQQRSQFTYGAKQDRNFRLSWLQGRDPALEKEVIQFVSRTVNVPEPSSTDIAEWLSDGRILCKLLEKMAPGTVQLSSKRPQLSSTENIQIFLRRCRELGFEEQQLFEQSDLVDRKNLAKVINCLACIRSEILAKNQLQFYI